MKNALKVKIFAFIILLSALFTSSFANAQVPGRQDQNAAFAKAANLNTGSSVGSIIGVLITAALGLLAVIFIILLIIAGFQWMTAEGDEEKINKAKQTISRAIIGLAIVIAAYSITYFVFNALSSASVGGTHTVGGS